LPRESKISLARISTIAAIIFPYLESCFDQAASFYSAVDS